MASGGPALDAQPREHRVTFPSQPKPKPGKNPLDNLLNRMFSLEKLSIQVDDKDGLDLLRGISKQLTDSIKQRLASIDRTLWNQPDLYLNYASPEILMQLLNFTIRRLEELSQTAVSQAPSQPSQAPSQPSQAPFQPSQASSQPSQAPSQPSQAPSQPSQAPSQPSQAPSQPSRFSQPSSQLSRATSKFCQTPSQYLPVVASQLRDLQQACCYFQASENSISDAPSRVELAIQQFEDRLQRLYYCVRYPYVLHENMGLTYFSAIRKQIDMSTLRYECISLGQLNAFLQSEDAAFLSRAGNEVIPRPWIRWEFTTFFDLPDTKVVIIGQDPHPSPGCNDINDGLAFSYSRRVPYAREGSLNFPASLEKIFQVLQLDSDVEAFRTPEINGQLDGWAKQRVLLMNCALTVRKGQSGSHLGHGWEDVTGAIVREIWNSCRGVVFMAWGGDAQDLMKKHCSPADWMWNEPDAAKKHLPLSASHPTQWDHAASYPRHFSRCNQHLVDIGREPIDWNCTSDYPVPLG